jgi:hypothetical protein
MEDSEKKPGQPETPPAKPETTTEIVLHPRSGTPVVQIRGAGGKYVKQNKTAATSKARRDVLRNLLDAGIAGPDGKFKRGGKSRFQLILDNQIKNAMMDASQPVLDKFGNPLMIEGKPVMVTDPKIMMASTQAFKEIMLRADGKYATSEEDLEAQKLHGVKIVVITPPPEMLNREVTEDKPREKLLPSFIEGEFTDDKDKI